MNYVLAPSQNELCKTTMKILCKTMKTGCVKLVWVHITTPVEISKVSQTFAYVV